MILTVTLNPSVDISYPLDTFLMDTTNRVEDVSKTAGGKGLNVARVLHQLDVDVGATGFLGGSLGTFIQSQVGRLGIQDFFVGISGETRNCIAVIHEGQQTEILESGPTISEKEAALFLTEFKKQIKKVDLITISGSLPKGVTNDFYSKLIEIADDQDIPVLLDASGSLLLATLERGPLPFLIKPNEEELAGVLGKETIEEADIFEALKVEPFEHIPWVVVTLGAKGAIVKQDKTFYKVTIPVVEAVNPVGSGDSVVAGFAAGFTKDLKDAALIKYGLAMGVLNALEAQTGQINPENIQSIMDQINVEEV